MEVIGHNKKSGQIPAFGDWDKANELPITQYFECARQAGLVPYTSSSVESDPYETDANGYAAAAAGGGGGGGGDLYAVHYAKPSLRTVNAPPRKINKRYSDVKERNNQVGKVRDTNMKKDHPKYHKPLSQKQFSEHVKNESMDLVAQRHVKTVKPVDEDLYKIPDELLHKSERKRRLGFLSKCLVPPCKT